MRRIPGEEIDSSIEPGEWSEPEPATSFRTIDGKPIYWRDGRGVVHACEGADIHPGVRVLWTLCGKDVPADTAYQAEGEVITCPIYPSKLGKDGR